jgi:hypothetical protein
MITDFIILSGETVPRSYSWDRGVPFESPINTFPLFVDNDLNTDTQYVSGYAPGVKVVFQNTSKNPEQPGVMDFTWTFGDYYNDLLDSVTLPCSAPVQHIYTMPGRYTVTLHHNYTINTTIIDIGPQFCRGKWGIQWYWDNVRCDVEDGTTWNQTRKGRKRDKWWVDESSCFQKYCQTWTWQSLSGCNISEENIRQFDWQNSRTGSIYEKKWSFEANDEICFINVPSNIPFIEARKQFTTKKYIVDVKELSPKAGLFCLTRPITGVSPYTVTLTPRTTLCGSFPIDRIDWDFGDGSPILTVVRQNTISQTALVSSTTTTEQLTSITLQTILTSDFLEDLYNISLTPDEFTITDNEDETATIEYTLKIDQISERLVVTPSNLNTTYNNVFFEDIDDPRNFDVIHTYYRNQETYPVFYPSLTAYSANTGTYDAVSITLGPISLPSIKNKDVIPVKVASSSQGNLYVFNNEKNCSFASTTNKQTSFIAPKTAPLNSIRDTFGAIVPYRGNLGLRYPQLFVPTCSSFEDLSFSTDQLFKKIVTEESNTTMLNEITAVVQENEMYILV